MGRRRIEQIRDHKLKVAEGAPAHVIARHRGLNGELLQIQVAAVELLNLLRPIVAIAVYIAFIALALRKYPQYAGKVKADKDNEVEHFVQEVRRFYPFFPCVRDDFEWRGYRFPKGTPVLLDIYGINRDPDLWQRPEMFWPERFNRRPDNPFDFIPQGGGGHATGHRCAGEWITIEIMKVAVTFLTNCMACQVSEQDLSFKLARMPTVPNSGFVISQVKGITSPGSSANTLLHPT